MLQGGVRNKFVDKLYILSFLFPLFFWIKLDKLKKKNYLKKESTF